MKIIFAGRFLWFFLASLVFYILLAINLVFNEPGYTMSSVYGILYFPAVLLIFYPTAFGIQNDADTRILEILGSAGNDIYTGLAVSRCFLRAWLLRTGSVSHPVHVGSINVSGGFSGMYGVHGFHCCEKWKRNGGHYGYCRNFVVNSERCA